MLQLGDFLWPKDPESLRVTYTRKVEQKLSEDGLCSTDNLGRFGRVFEGEGIFCGENAYETLRELAAYLCSGEVKKFLHPKWDQANVILTDLCVTEECEDHFLRYSFRMVEVL